MFLEEWQSWGNIWQVQIFSSFDNMFKLAFVLFHNFQLLPPKAIQTAATGNTRAFWNTTARNSARYNYDQDVTKFLSSGKLWSRCKEVFINWKMDPCSDFQPDFKWFGKPLACRSALPQDLGSGSCSARHSLREFSAARFENRFNQVSKIRMWKIEATK